MQAHTALAPLRLPAMAGHAAQRQLEKQLRRFDKRHRAPLAWMASRHPRIADLAFSFPALLFALSVRRAGFPASAVIDAVIRGDSLKNVAQLAGLPLWLRKLPPEMFVGPIPKLPDGEVFRRRICNALPKRKSAMRRWLAVVAFAAYWGGEDFAVWAAAQLAKPKARGRGDWARLSLWAWHSLRPDLPASGLIATPWTPAIAIDSARDAARVWLSAVNARLAGLSAAPLILPRECREVDGYVFQPIVTREEVIAEADAMENCIRDYLDDVADGTVAFWSVRQGDARKAVLAVERLHWNPIPRIHQMQAKGNVDAPAEVWRAAAKWLAGHDLVAACAPGLEHRAVN
ncbi:MAG: PcfJ domain-containing protein [Aestuariivirga sp.]|uniref:hypothetical protein n=1 Tax=Aestuariivirga sp. TaxID=2650926 RepID=UPI0025C15191|nr:hypothetical protein [Aestuariivirga sp.]MCA3562365.1 PcfJ domain-containing protein [Aestuariivirga sp.]